jgi:hypothetical protein
LRELEGKTASVSPWWIWPNLLSLDAPLVAIVWQRFLGHTFGVAIPCAATAALAAVVWAIYLADRLLDGRRGFVSDRHLFAAAHPRAFATGAVLAAVTAFMFAVFLPMPYWRAGGVVALGVLAYLVIVHTGCILFRVSGTKELLVAIGFAAGVGLPLAAVNLPWVVWLPTATAFLGLCLLNCRLIDRWEAPIQSSQPWPESLLGITILAFAPMLPTEAAIAIITAMCGLFAVHLVWASRPRAARVLADAVLLTPIVFAGWQ